jgi:hypothetical protein
MSKSVTSDKKEEEEKLNDSDLDIDQLNTANEDCEAV